MEQQIHWSKKLFGSTAIFYAGTTQVGFINLGSFSRTRTALLNNETYVITRDGLFNNTFKFKVYDKKTNREVATVMQQGFGGNFTIYLLSGEQWEWSINLSGLKWSLTGADGLNVHGNIGREQYGSATSNSMQALPIILGVFLSTRSKNHVFFLLFIVLIIVFLILR